MRLMILFITNLSVCLALSACSLEVPNNEICRDKGRLGAHCNMTNQDAPRDVRQPEWDETRFGWFCMSETAFAKNQRFFEQACELVNGCKVEKLRKKHAEILRRFDVEFEK